jgi:hypothetical protein
VTGGTSSFLARMAEPEGHYVRVTVFAGPMPHDRAHCGVLTMRPQEAADFALDLASARPLREAAARVLALHVPHLIYDECGHRHEEGDQGVTEIPDVGLTCQDGYAYTICRHCCASDGLGQGEMCCDDNQHLRKADQSIERTCWPCPTALALGVQPDA